MPPAAATPAEYVAFRTPAGRLAVVTESGGAAIVIENDPDFVAPLESVTVADTDAVPGAAGVPVTAPLEETLKPSLAVPDQVYEPVPPLAASCPEYACATCPAGRLAVIVSGAAVTVMLKAIDAVTGGVSLSAVEIVKLKTPGVVAVPVSVLFAKLVPVGADPVSVIL
jgi:hypothetical protein